MVYNYEEEKTARWRFWGEEVLHGGRGAGNGTRGSTSSYFKSDRLALGKRVLFI